MPVQVCPEFLDEIFKAIEADPKAEIYVDLPNQKISLTNSEHQESFDISAYKKENLTNGFDDIDYLLNMNEEIDEFAAKTPL